MVKEGAQLEVAENKEKTSTEKLLDAIQNEVPIYTGPTNLNDGPMGDIFVFTWCLKTVAEYVAKQHGVDKIPKITHFDEKDSFNFYDAFPNSQTLNTKQRTITERYLSANANRVGVTLPDEIYQLHPTPFKFEHAKFEVDEQRIKEKATELREKLQGKKLIVVSVAGSRSEKRFSFRQVQIIVRKLRDKYPGAHIVVLSDANTLKHHMFDNNLSPRDRDEYQRFNDEAKEYDPVGEALLTSFGEDTQSSFTFEDKTLTVNRATNIRNEYDTKKYHLDADEYTLNEDLNSLAAYGEVADLVVTTDTFWSWWMAPAKRLMILYSMANEYWEVPGSIPVWSRFVKSADMGKRSHVVGEPSLYRDFFKKETGRKSYFGPSYSDILNLVKKFKDLPSTIDEL